MLWVGLSIFIIVDAVYVAYWYLARKRRQKVLALMAAEKANESQYILALANFRNLLNQDWYISDRQFRLWKDTNKGLAGKYVSDFATIQTKDPIKQLLVDFHDYYSNGRKYIDATNSNFVLKETPTIEKILDKKEIQHNDEQVNAVASDEDNTLLVAGAGTGKTTTILGKIAYLIDRAQIKPEEILLLSFTGRAVEELNDRILKKFGNIGLYATTFHSFGLDVIGSVLGKKPDLAFPSTSSKQEFLDAEFDAQLQDSAYLQKAIVYFSYYLRPVVTKPGFKSLDDYYKNAKTEEHLTLRKEQLKSQQEVIIANFLYINGVEYEYERDYEFETASRKYRQYKPDFYLPEYNIYIEHFGIDRNGGTHFSTNEAQNAIQSKKYQSDMIWKRHTHKVNGTKLIETFSYEFTEGIWREVLTEKLRQQNVAFVPRDPSEILQSLRKSGHVKEIAQLFGTFLSLTKANGYSLGRLREIITSRESQRERAFFDIFAPIYQAYESFLSRTGLIDFDDMLLKSAQFIRENKFENKFKYIIIDEFQDFSISKYHLVKALCDKSPDIKLFCVGDDWQSIFRFSGSDISLMSNFEESYGFTRQNQLVRTNRFTNELADISNKFISKNPNQISKSVSSSKISGKKPLVIRYKDSRNGDLLIQELLQEINNSTSQLDRKTEVFLLGRYRHLKPDGFDKLVKEYQNLKIEFLTIHASKGSEADYVIILDAISGKFGLPSEIADDPLLDIVLSKSDSYPHAEERRLMYVAMTRAREKVYVLTERGRQSPFVLELEGGQVADGNKQSCPECGGELTVRTGTYGSFWGCKNFPHCTYTQNIESHRRGR